MPRKQIEVPSLSSESSESSERGDADLGDARVNRRLSLSASGSGSRLARTVSNQGQREPTQRGRLLALGIDIPCRHRPETRLTIRQRESDRKPRSRGQDKGAGTPSRVTRRRKRKKGSTARAAAVPVARELREDSVVQRYRVRFLRCFSGSTPAADFFGRCRQGCLRAPHVDRSLRAVDDFQAPHRGQAERSRPAPRSAAARGPSLHPHCRGAFMDVLLTLILSCSVHLDESLVEALAYKLRIGNQYFVADWTTLNTYDTARTPADALCLPSGRRNFARRRPDLEIVPEGDYGDGDGAAPVAGSTAPERQNAPFGMDILHPPHKCAPGAFSPHGGGASSRGGQTHAAGRTQPKRPVPTAVITSRDGAHSSERWWRRARAPVATTGSMHNDRCLCPGPVARRPRPAAESDAASRTSPMNRGLWSIRAARS
jgi:hypothetical protein